MARDKKGSGYPGPHNTGLNDEMCLVSLVFLVVRKLLTTPQDCPQNEYRKNTDATLAW